MYIDILAFIILICIIYYFNSGKVKKLKDENNNKISNSISEKIFLDNNGIKLGMFILGENIDNPILLFLHGGPGSSEIIFMDYTNPAYRLEKLFTVVYLDQRGSSLSNPKNLSVNDITVDNMIKDNLFVTEYLQKRFNKDKIYIMGHSWGTYLAIRTIKQYPQYYYASINSSQLVDTKESEILAYHQLANHALSINDTKAINTFKQFNIEDESFPSKEYLMKVRSKYLDKYGYGLTHKKTSMIQLLFKLLLFKEYTLIEKYQLINGLAKSSNAILDQLIDFNISNINKFDVPIYFMQGEYDFQTSTVLATSYYESIIAPQKDLLIFKDCAHSPFIEDKQLAFEYLETIIDKTLN